MEHLLHIGLSNAVVAGVLALVALLIGVVWRRPALSHALWLLVLLKLLTPPLIAIPIPWHLAGPSEVSETRTRNTPSPGVAQTTLGVATKVEELRQAERELARAVEVPPIHIREEAEANSLFILEPVPPPQAIRGVVEEPPAVQASPAQELPVEETSAEKTGTTTTSHMKPWQVGMASWLVGSLCWFLLASRRIWHFRTLLRHARKGSSEWQQRTAELARQLGLQNPPEVWLLPGRLPPMLWALGGKPRLLLPEHLAEHVSREGMDTLLLHELAHQHRGDHWVRQLEFVVMGLYWWLPVVWLARRQLREAEEQCCDAWVVSTLPDAGRTYATALVDTLDFLAGASRPVQEQVPLLASGLGQVSDLRRRLKMIMNGTTPRRMNWTGWVIVLGLGALLLPLLPLGAQAEDEKKEEKKKAEKKEQKRATRQIEIELAGTGDVTRGTEEELRRMEEALRRQLEQVQAARKRLQARKAAKQPPRGTGGVIRIEIQLDGNKVKVEELREKLKKAFSGAKWFEGAQRRVIILGGLPMPPHPPGVPARVPGVRVHVPPIAVPAAQFRNRHFHIKPDPRIERLERKMDEVIRQLETMRKMHHHKHPHPPGKSGPAPRPPKDRIR